MSRVEWAIDVVQGPASEPVTLEEARQHLRVTVADPAEDALILRCIRAATRWAESYAGRAFVRRTLRLRMERFPRGAIRLPWPPVVSVVSVVYKRLDGAEVTIPPTTYEVVSGEPSLVVPVTAWPSEPLGAGLPVSVTYEAGNGASEDEQAAVLLLTASLYENRQDEVTDATPRPILFGARALLWPNRRVYEGPDAP